MVYLLSFLSYFTGSEIVFAHPPIRSGFDDKYRSISYRFVDRQKPAQSKRRQDVRNQRLMDAKVKCRFFIENQRQCVFVALTRFRLKLHVTMNPTILIINQLQLEEEEEEEQHQRQVE